MSNFNIAYFFGFIGATLMVTSYLMKSMLPLRVVALVARLMNDAEKARHTAEKATLPPESPQV